jgi:hypothetical protein
MVFHDEDLGRLTDESGPLNARSAAELGRIKLSGSDDTIPTFAQVLSLIGGAVPLLVEIKDQSLIMSQTDGRLEQATALSLEDYSGEVALMSFNPHSVAHMARLCPARPRGLTTSAYESDWGPLSAATCDALREIPDYDRTLSSFISHEAHDLARPRVADLKAQGNLGRVSLMTFSEFGRRVKENASGGTDHGAAAPLFLAGGGVKAGLLGQMPSLAPKDLFDGDVKYNTDFRSVYATVLEKHLGVKSEPILKKSFPLIPVYA